MRYRKRPLEVEAVKWEPSRKPSEYPQWLWDNLAKNPERFDASSGVVALHTLEGVMRANPGDYIVRGIKGELYPVKPGIFEESYEEVS